MTVLKHQKQLKLQQMDLKLLLKKAIQKIAEATGGLIINKIVDVVAKLCSDENNTRTTSQSKSIISIQAENTEEIPREIYIPPQKKKIIIIIIIIKTY